MERISPDAIVPFESFMDKQKRYRDSVNGITATETPNDAPNIADRGRTINIRLEICRSQLKGIQFFDYDALYPVIYL